VVLVCPRALPCSGSHVREQAIFPNWPGPVSHACPEPGRWHVEYQKAGCWGLSCSDSLIYRWEARGDSRWGQARPSWSLSNSGVTTAAPRRCREIRQPWEASLQMTVWDLKVPSPWPKVPGGVYKLRALTWPSGVCTCPVWSTSQWTGLDKQRRADPDHWPHLPSKARAMAASRTQVPADHVTVHAVPPRPQ
jgi:hypothetical protein